MEAIRSIFYAFWAQISTWHVVGRAAISIGVMTIFLWPVCSRLFKRIIIILCSILNGFVRLLYRIMADYILPITHRNNYAYIQNRLSKKNEIIEKRLTERKQKIYLKRKKIHPVRMLLVYGLLIFVIALPFLISNFTNDEYIKYFSYGTNLYISIEKPILEKAASYKPLIKTIAENTAPHNQQIVITEDNVSLLDGPSFDSKAIKVLYMGDEGTLMESNHNKNSEWIYIYLSDGTEGWVNRDYVEQKDTLE